MTEYLKYIAIYTKKFYCVKLRFIINAFHRNQICSMILILLKALIFFFFSILEEQFAELSKEDNTLSFLNELTFITDITKSNDIDILDGIILLINLFISFYLLVEYIFFIYKSYQEQPSYIWRAKRILQSDLNQITEDDVLKAIQDSQHHLVKELMSLIIELYSSILLTPIIFFAFNTYTKPISLINILLSAIIGLIKIDSDYCYTIQNSDFKARPFSNNLVIIFLMEYIAIGLVKFTTGADYFIICLYYGISGFYGFLICPYYQEETQFWNIYANTYFGLLSLIYIFISISHNNLNLYALAAMFLIPFSYKIVSILKQSQILFNQDLLQSIFKDQNQFRVIDIDNMIRQKIFDEGDSRSENEKRKIKIFNLIAYKLNQQKIQREEEIKKEQEKQTNQSQSQFQSTVFRQEIKEIEIFQNETIDLRLFIKEAMLKLCKKKFQIYLQFAYLIYLLEVMKCTKSYWTEYSIICKKNLSIKERQIIYSIHSVFIKQKAILQQTYQEDSPYDMSIQDVLQFEQSIEKAFENMDITIRMKINLLSIMKQKAITIKELMKRVKSLRTEQKLLRSELNNLAEINNNSSDLLSLQICYLENLSFSSSEIKISFNSFLKGNKFSQKTRMRNQRQLLTIKPQENQQKKLKKQKINLFQEQEIQEKSFEITKKVLFDQTSCVVFASIEENFNLLLKKVSNNFCEVFQVTKKEALNKKIDQFMPQNTPLASKHRKYVASYFSQQEIFHNNLQGKLLFGQTSKGFIVPFKMSLRLNYSQELQEIGFCALIRVMNDKSQYMMYNSSNNGFIGITKELQTSIFSKYTFTKKFDLGQIFPFLQKIKVVNKTQTCGTEWDAMMTTVGGDLSLLHSDIMVSTMKRVQNNQKDDELLKKYENTFEFLLVLDSRKDALNSYTTSGQTLMRLINDKEYIFYFMEIKLYASQYKELSNINYMQIMNIKNLQPQLNGPLIIQQLKENYELYSSQLSKPNLDKLIQQVHNRHDRYQNQIETSAALQIDQNNNQSTFNQILTSSQYEKRFSLASEKNVTIPSIQNNLANRLQELGSNHHERTSISQIQLNGNTNLHTQNQQNGEFIQVQQKQTFDEIIDSSQLDQSKCEEVDEKQHKEEENNHFTQSAQRQLGDILLSPSAFSGAGILSDNNRDVGEFAFPQVEYEECNKIQEKIDTTIRNKQQSRMSTQVGLLSPIFTPQSNNDLLKGRYHNQSTSFQLDKKEELFNKKQSFLIGNSMIKGQSQIYDQSNTHLGTQQQRFFQEKSATNQHILDDFCATKEFQENLQLSTKMKSSEQREKHKKRIERDNLDIASTKSRESSTSTKRTLIHLIKAKQKILAMRIINLIGFVTFLVLIIVTVQQYITIVNSLQITQNNLQVLDWPQDIQNTINKLQFNFNTLSLIRQNEFAFSSNNTQAIFDSLLTNRLFNIKDTFIDLLDQMESNDSGSDLFIMLDNQVMTFQNAIYYDPKNLTGASSRRVDYFTEGINVSLLYSTILFSQYVFRQAISPGARFTEFLTLTNLKSFVNSIEVIQNEFQVLQEDLDQTVESKLEQLLIIILVVSAVCLSIVIPVYSFIQSKKDMIINLFCTFPTTQLNFMIWNIKTTYYQNKIMVPFIKQIPTEIQQININSQLEQAHIKKQTMSQINRLPRFRIFILIGLIFTYLLISLYPIINKVVTQQYVDQQRNDLYLFTSISYLRDFIFNSAGMLTFTLVMRLYPTIKVLKIEDWIENVDNIMVQEDGIIELMQNITSYKEELVRYNNADYENFFFSIFENDICQTIGNNPSFILNATNFQPEFCASIQNGFLTKGLKLSIQKYINYVNDLNTVIQTTDANQLLTARANLFQTFNITDFTYLVDYLGETITLQQNFLQYSSQKYFQYITSVQLALLIFQVVLMVLVFGLGWNQFSYFLNEEVNRTKQYLQVINIDYLLDNNYILTFVKNNQQI